MLKWDFCRFFWGSIQITFQLAIYFCETYKSNFETYHISLIKSQKSFSTFRSIKVISAREIFWKKFKSFEGKLKKCSNSAYELKRAKDSPKLWFSWRLYGYCQCLKVLLFSNAQVTIVLQLPIIPVTVNFIRKFH